ncbi:hypothetical protein AB1N83_011562 [Pleurotus pulmonarius]
MDDEGISDTEVSLEKLERALRATKVRYRWKDNITPPRNTRTETANTKKRAVSSSGDEHHLDTRLPQIRAYESEDDDDVFSPTPTRPRVLGRLIKQRPGGVRSREMSDTDTTIGQLRGESATKGPEAAHAKKMKFYRGVMEDLTPLLGLDAGGKTDEELGLIRQLIGILTAERVRLNEIKKEREHGGVTQKKAGILKSQSCSAAK